MEASSLGNLCYTDSIHLELGSSATIARIADLFVRSLNSFKAVACSEIGFAKKWSTARVTFDIRTGGGDSRHRKRLASIHPHQGLFVEIASPSIHMLTPVWD
jgi:hypothetical protein